MTERSIPGSEARHENGAELAAELNGIASETTSLDAGSNAEPQDAEAIRQARLAKIRAEIDRMPVPGRATGKAAEALGGLDEATAQLLQKTGRQLNSAGAGGTPTGEQRNGLVKKIRRLFGGGR